MIQFLFAYPNIEGRFILRSGILSFLKYMQITRKLIYLNSIIDTGIKSIDEERVLIHKSDPQPFYLTILAVDLP